MKFVLEASQKADYQLMEDKLESATQYVSKDAVIILAAKNYSV